MSLNSVLKLNATRALLEATCIFRAMGRLDGASLVAQR